MRGNGGGLWLGGLCNAKSRVQHLTPRNQTPALTEQPVADGKFAHACYITDDATKDGVCKVW